MPSSDYFPFSPEHIILRRRLASSLLLSLAWEAENALIPRIKVVLHRVRPYAALKTPHGMFEWWRFFYGYFLNNIAQPGQVSSIFVMLQITTRILVEDNIVSVSKTAYFVKVTPQCFKAAM